MTKPSATSRESALGFAFKVNVERVCVGIVVEFHGYSCFARCSRRKLRSESDGLNDRTKSKPRRGEIILARGVSPG